MNQKRIGELADLDKKHFLTQLPRLNNNKKTALLLFLQEETEYTFMMYLEKNISMEWHHFGMSILVMVEKKSLQRQQSK